MKLEDVVYSSCRYKIERFELFYIDGTETKSFEVDPLFLETMYLECDYDNYFYPYFEVSVMLPIPIITKMKKHNHEIEAHLRISYIYDDNPTDLAKNKSYQKTDWFSSRFIVYMTDNTPDLNERYNESLYRKSGVEETDYIESSYGKERLLLYNANYLNRLNLVVNNVLLNATVTDMIAYILISVGVSKVLMTPATNFKRYSQTLITPIPALEQLTRIRDTYGIHKHGSIIFFDLCRGYILSKEKRCTAWFGNEIRTVYLISNSSNATNTALVGCYRNPIERYCAISVPVNSINVQTQSMIDDQIYGSEIIEVNEKGIIGTGNANSIRLKGSSNLSRVLYKAEGDTTISSKMSKLEEDSHVVKAEFIGCCTDFLSPQREFKFIFDTSRYKNLEKKTFRITKFTAQFIKDGKEFVSNCNVTLKG